MDYATLENQPTKPDWVYLDRLGQSMREAMELDLFGFDVIIDSQTNQYGIIDINFFPGELNFHNNKKKSVGLALAKHNKHYNSFQHGIWKVHKALV